MDLRNQTNCIVNPILAQSKLRLFFNSEFQVRNYNGTITHGIGVHNLNELRARAAQLFGKTNEPVIYRDNENVIVNCEKYFQVLLPETTLVAVFGDEQWTQVNRI